MQHFGHHGQRWGFLLQSGAEAAEIPVIPLYLDQHSPGGVAHETVQFVPFGQPVDKGAEANPLDDAPDLELQPFNRHTASACSPAVCRTLGPSAGPALPRSVRPTRRTR